MTAFFGALRDAAVNYVRDAQLGPRQMQARETMRRELGMIKVKALVVSVAAFIFFVLWPNLATFGLAAVIAYGTFEVHNLATNFKEILDDATLEVRVRLSRENFIAQLTKSAPLARSILGIISPSQETLNGLLDVGRF
ncbi:MAG TPA: hypothetical protein VLF94_02160 [Chlamydiales bacterium]|nr:hypothetical protein [Chlamydiales bacterium]